MGGGGSITLDDCTNISAKSLSDGIEIKWTDPEDVIFNGQVTARWTGTKLVRKEGGYPTSVTDGVLVKDSKTRNEHSVTGFRDAQDLKDDITYYYCLFPYTEKAVTMSDNNRFTCKYNIFDKVLKNNSWKQIALASEQGIAQTLWKIGDEIDVVLSGSYFNETVTLQIWDFNHYEKSDGSGKAGILFGMKDLMSQARAAGNNGGCRWDTSDMRQIVMQQILSSIPSDLQQNIKEVKIKSMAAYTQETVYTNDKIFIPACREVGFTDHPDESLAQIPIFTDDNSRIKNANNVHYGPYDWLTRTGASNQSASYVIVTSIGTRDLSMFNNINCICFCFNI